MSIPLWPRSLRSRLMLVMTVGLLLALVVSNFIHWKDRGRFMRQMSGGHYVEQVVAAVRLLDSETGAARADVLRILQTVPFRAEWLPVFPVKRLAAVETNEMSREIKNRLTQRIGSDRRIFFGMLAAPVISSSGDEPFRRGHQPRGVGAPPGHEKPYGQWRQARPRNFNRPPPGAGFIAVVELNDGSAVRFVYRVSPDTGKWPTQLLVSMSILLIAAILLSALAVRLVVRPLRLVSDQAEHIGNNLEAAPMPEKGPMELRSVACAMNGMQGKIRKLFEQRSRFLAAVSHDLRTPITRMRLRAELIEDEEQRRKMEQDLAEMESMVQETLEYMRDDASREPLQKTDLGALIEALADDFEAQGLQPVLNWNDVRVVVLARPLALKRCLGNVIANAFHHADNVQIRLTSETGNVCVSILDDGSGIPESELERVFEPFYRLDKSRQDGGSGLGLSIARNIIESLGGSLRLYNRASGGLEARICVPTAST